MRIALLSVLSFALSCGDEGFRSISTADLEDKIAGGWAGQMIGVSYGWPTEFRHLEEIIPEDQLPTWEAKMVDNALDQDDLYVDMTFAQVLDEKGLDATTDDFGAMFRDAEYRLWHANLSARRALRRGVPATKSGTPEFNAHANDIDFQIEADFVGLMCPGMPQAVNDLCERAGRVMNHGDGIYGGMFVSCMYAEGFFETDPVKVVEAGLACMPQESPYALLIKDTLEWYAQHPDDWMKVWQLIEDKWNKREPCPSGAMKPFNIDAKLNGAYIALGLLYGESDFEKTLNISTRCGQDSDCNPSNALGILGVMLGYKALPQSWQEAINGISDQKFNYTNYSFDTIVDSTVKRAIAQAEKDGGRMDGDRLMIKDQPAIPAKLDLWDDYGSPVERISWSDTRWQWKGAWKEEAQRSRRGADSTLASASAAGAEASITFSGTGAIISGPFIPTGGQAEVYVDGELDRTVDSYSDETGAKRSESIWHKFGLADAEHTVRLVVKGEPYGDSAGADVTISDLVVFR